MDWITASDYLRAPMFAPLRGAIGRLPADRWPTHADLTNAAAGLTTAGGMPLRFVMPRDDVQSCPRGGNPPDRERRYYEVRIFETGEVETRPENWHDLFNALAWIAFPRAKAAINAQHAAILAERGDAEAKHRGSERDSLTLFDEGGIAVVSSDPALFGLIVDFEWKTLFWHRRDELERHMRFIAFGHALFEQSLAPYLGMVAKTIFLPIATLPDEALLPGAVDGALAHHFAARDRFASPRLMAPMPILGIPGWEPANACEEYYDDRAQFRPGRSGEPALRK